MTADEQDFDLATPPAYAASILQAFALASLTWGRLEAEVDHLLMLTYAEAAATAGVREQIPNAWSSKCKAIVDRFTKVSGLASKASKPEQLAQDLREAAEARHALVHGGFAGFVPGEPPKLDMIRYVFEGASGQVTLKHYSIAEADLHRFREGITARWAQVLRLSMWVAGRDDPAPSRTL